MFKFPSVLAVTAATIVASAFGSGLAGAHGAGHGLGVRSGVAAPVASPRSGSWTAPRMAELRSSGGSPSGGSGSTSRSGSVGGGGNIGPAPVTPLPPSTGPSSTLGPMQPLQPIPPLAQPLPTQITGGGTATNLALSPGSGSTSPSESAPSVPGGGGKTLADCMGFWDKETHMSKAEWRAACKRTMAENPSIR
jgi:hypothetical protein